MVKIFLFIALISASISADGLQNGSFSTEPSVAQSSLAIKSLLLKSPKELDAKTAIMVGNIYQNGMADLRIHANPEKAKRYYESGAKRGQAMGNLLLANMAIKEKNIQEYEKQMHRVMKSGDEQLSIPAGLQLAAFYTSFNKNDKAVSVLLYLANVYDEPSAQFMVGWSIVSGAYTPPGMNIEDGKGYLNTACSNPKRTEKITQKCNQILK